MGLKSRIIGLLIAAIPVGYAGLRAVATGTDFRYVWLALASTLSAAFILVVANRARPHSPGLVVRTAFVLLAAMGAAEITAFALGAGSAPALAVAALGFATCGSAGLALALRSGAVRIDGRARAG